MEERIIKLESLAAMQDQTIQSLNQELYRQQQDLAKVLRKLESLEERMKELQNSGEIAGNERPPHW